MSPDPGGDAARGVTGASVSEPRRVIPAVDAAALTRAIEAAVSDSRLGVTPGVTVDVLKAEAGRIARSLVTGEPLDVDADPYLLTGLIEEIQAQVVRGWLTMEPPPPSQSMIETLTAFDALRAGLHGRSHKDDARIPMPDGHQFAAGVAHDLRSPLTSILFLAETLLSGQSGGINETQRRQLGIIYSAALGLTAVASDIIELVRGGDGLTEREPTLFSVTEILESVHDIVRPMAEEKGLGVHLFPPAIDHRFGYPLALSRVLLNLTTNGLKFTDSGFVEIAVRATSPVHLEFSVRDTGRGYAPEALETLYEPFRLSRAAKGGFGFSGSGLGLAISRKLIAAMGSSLQVETRSRWGTRFHFEVELPPGASSDEDPEEP